jgi:hypothetical protein
MRYGGNCSPMRPHGVPPAREASTVHAGALAAEPTGLVDPAAVLWQLHDLRRALMTRDAIAEAKGLLMEREGVNADEAFDILRRASQRANVKLRDVAAELIEAHETRTSAVRSAAEAARQVASP